MRLLIVLFSLFLIHLQYLFWVGKNGWFDNQTMQAKINDIQIQKAEREQRNNALRAEIDDLRNGINALEERARLERGMLKENEVFYRIIPSNHK